MTATQNNNNNNNNNPSSSNKQRAPRSNNRKNDGGPLTGTNLSKSLSYVLRHGAVKQKIAVRSDGFVLLSDILNQQKFKGVTLDMVKEVVAACQKQRFKLEQLPIDSNEQQSSSSGEEKLEWYIRANQGHSFSVPDLDLKPITSAEQAPVCIHGTYHAAWAHIKKTGLSKMSRQHIHFATGVAHDETVISGMRNTAQVLIHMNVAKLIADGVPLLQSDNKVLLSPGIGETGAIPTAYFHKVIDAQTQQELPF